MGTLGDFMRTSGLLYRPYVGVAGTDKVGEQQFNHVSQVVQFDDDANKVASAEASIIFSGPPVWNPSKLKVSGGFAGLLYPIGAVQGFSTNAAPQLIPYPEVGSRNKRVAVGVANYSATMGRVLSWHDNLLHSLYQWLPKMLGGAKQDMLFRPGNKKGRGQFHYTNLDSELFRVPFGILEIKITAGGELISSRYLEKCYVQNEGDAITAGQTLIVENASLYVTRIVPADDVTVIDSIANNLEKFGFMDLFQLGDSFNNDLYAGTDATS